MALWCKLLECALRRKNTSVENISFTAGMRWKANSERGSLEQDLQSKIDAFLGKAKRSDFWRAVELHKELVGPGDDRLMEIKVILETGIDEGKYERKIVQKKKVWLVGYRLKSVGGVPEKAVPRVEEEGWERRA